MRRRPQVVPRVGFFLLLLIAIEREQGNGQEHTTKKHKQPKSKRPHAMDDNVFYRVLLVGRL